MRLWLLQERRRTVPHVLIIGGIIVLLAVGFVVAMLVERKRVAALKSIAEEIGLTFYPKGDDALRSRLKGFHLFSQGHARKISNLLHGKARDIECSIFDYQYTTSSDKSSRNYSQTVICFRSPALHLPAFSLRPEHIFHRILPGYRDIDFEGYSGFSKAYLLMGENEDAVRALFSDRVLAFYDNNKGLSTEGEGDCLVHYHESKRVKPAELRAFMEKGFQVLELFQSK